MTTKRSPIYAIYSVQTQVLVVLSTNKWPSLSIINCGPSCALLHASQLGESDNEIVLRMLLIRNAGFEEFNSPPKDERDKIKNKITTLL